MATNDPQPLKVELTHRAHLPAAAIEAITDPAVAKRFADDLFAFATFARAHARFCHAWVYQTGAADAARGARDEARDALSTNVLSVDGCHASVAEHRTGAEQRRVAEAKQRRKRMTEGEDGIAHLRGASDGN